MGLGSIVFGFYSLTIDMRDIRHSVSGQAGVSGMHVYSLHQMWGVLNCSQLPPTLEVPSERLDSHCSGCLF